MTGIEKKEENSGDIVDDLKDLLGKAEDRLYETARFYADRFWEHHLLGDKTEQENKPSCLGCRVRKKGQGVYMEWYYNTWRKKIDGRSQPFSHHIPKSKRGFSYDLRKLYTRAPQWEYPLITETEAIFSNLRQQNSQLASMRRNLHVLSRLRQDGDQKISAMIR